MCNCANTDCGVRYVCSCTCHAIQAVLDYCFVPKEPAVDWGKLPLVEMRELT